MRRATLEGGTNTVDRILAMYVQSNARCGWGLRQMHRPDEYNYQWLSPKHMALKSVTIIRFPSPPKTSGSIVLESRPETVSAAWPTNGVAREAVRAMDGRESAGGKHVQTINATRTDPNGRLHSPGCNNTQTGLRPPTGCAGPADSTHDQHRGLPSQLRVPSKPARARQVTLPAHDPADVGELVRRQPGFPTLGALYEEPLRICAACVTDDRRSCVLEDSRMPPQPRPGVRKGPWHCVSCD